MSTDPARAPQPLRWAGRACFVVLQQGFGLGERFLSTWAAWQADPQRSARLVVLAIEPAPVDAAALHQAHADGPWRALADSLARAWPAARTPDIHLLDLAEGRVRLMLAVGEPAALLPDLVLQADAILLDSRGMAPTDPALWRHLKRLAAPGCQLQATACGAAQRAVLSASGFTWDPGAEAGHPAGCTSGRFAPRTASRPPPGRQAQAGARSVAVLGAGLAGAAAARALARQGLAVTVFERDAAPAQQTSGNAGGLFHPVVHGRDGTHARWLRAGANLLQQVLAPLLASGQVAGRLDGLLRGEQTLDAEAMRALVHALALPEAHVQVREQALPDGRPAWFYPGAGWAAPADLVRAWLAEPGISTRCSTGVGALQPAPDGGWQLLGDTGQQLMRADAVVLCQAHGVQPLLGGPGWPLQRLRGQTTLLAADTPGLPALPVPLADQGYALRLADGRLLCGAVSQPDDEEPALRAADHARHLAQLEMLTGWRCPVPAQGPGSLARLDGRVGWRLSADDRLPVVGPVPRPPGAGERPVTQARFMPRVQGLWVFTALGSRGLTHAALGGELLAAWLSGAPCPVPAALMDALDPARFAVRALRQAESAAATAGRAPRAPG